MSEIKDLKITTVGDSLVGKRTLAHNFCQKGFYLIPNYNQCKVCDNHYIKIDTNEQSYNLTIVNAIGSEYFDRIRPFYYSNTNCFLLCYSITNRYSFEKMSELYVHEVRHHASDVPIILVATKIDLRKDLSQENLITTDEGIKMCKTIKADKFLECSAIDEQSLNELFDEAVRCAVLPKKEKKNRSCSLI